MNDAVKKELAAFRDEADDLQRFSAAYGEDNPDFKYLYKDWLKRFESRLEELET